MLTGSDRTVSIPLEALDGFHQESASIWFVVTLVRCDWWGRELGTARRKSRLAEDTNGDECIPTTETSHAPPRLSSFTSPTLHCELTGAHSCDIPSTILSLQSTITQVAPSPRMGPPWPSLSYSSLQSPRLTALVQIVFLFTKHRTNRQHSSIDHTPWLHSLQPCL